jgi:hypothetical protein
MEGKVKCSGCGWSWNKSDSSKKDMYVCHQCGKDNVMKNGGWLNKYDDGGDVQPNYNDASVSMSDDFVGLGYDTKGRNYSPAWGGQFQLGGKLNPVSPMQQVEQAVQPTPTVPYLQTKDPSEFYKSWIQSPEYAKRQLLTGYSQGEDLYMPNAAASRESRLGAIEDMTPITYSTREPSKATPGVYGSPSYVNINPSDYTGTSKQAIEAHELAHVAGAMGEVRPGMMSATEQDIFKKSMLPMKEPVLSGVQGSKEREASKRDLEDFKHSQEPDEVKADLDALRFMMYDKGIYDITKGKKFTETDFEKSKQSLGKDRVFNRLEKRVGKKNFVNLMNTIASADNQEELPMAMGGMSIPGSVGFTYARTAGSAPSEGKYAKKTMASAQNGIMSPMLLARNVLNYFYPNEENTNTVEAAPSDYKKGLTNELLQRQAYKESTFNPSAVSPAGYKGLTQIGEGVLQDYSNKKGGKKLDPFNPEDAVELQKFAMNDLYNASFINKPDQSDSVRIAKTLAAYNWGRGNLANYLNEQKNKGVDIYDSYDWLNNLPKETSDYINKILLQEDPSFNKNYKKASTNPKYEEVTSLYDQKKFGGDIPSAQNGKNDIEKISINDPRYPEMYKNRQVGLSYDDAISLPDLDEVTVTAPRSYTMDSLRDFTTAALYGIPENLAKLEQVPTAALAETAAMLTGKPYNFSNVNPNLGQFGSNQRDLSVLGYENPQGFLQNAANTALSMVDPALVTSGASMLRKSLQKKLAKSFSKNFKSEINWGNWNKEIPENTQLMKEYNAIEQTSKANGSWMKYSDGSNFNGTPEQFIQMKHPNTQNFAGGALEAEQMYKEPLYRGAHKHVVDFKNRERNDYATFLTNNEKNAETYATSDGGVKKYFHPDIDKEVEAYGKSYPLDVDGKYQLSFPQNLPIVEGKANGNNWRFLDYDKEIDPKGIRAEINRNSFENNLFEKKKYQYDYPENFDIRNNYLSTDDYANYVKNNPIGIARIKNVKDQMGYVKDIPANTVHAVDAEKVPIKSLRYNSGMFDVTNPNIYKGVIPAGVATALTFDQQKNGGITKDNQGYWNPDNFGKVVEIDSNYITMEGVYEPLLGVSDTGDTKLMKPGKNYKFKGKKVTEYPVGKLGINQLDAQPMKKLNQLLNFTNNPDKDNWLDKYN